MSLDQASPKVASAGKLHGDEIKSSKRTTKWLDVVDHKSDYSGDSEDEFSAAGEIENFKDCRLTAHVDETLEQNVIRCLGILLSRWIQQPTQSGKNSKRTRRHPLVSNIDKAEVAMQIISMLTRIREDITLNAKCFVIALVYLDRIVKTNPSLRPCRRSIHRFLLAAVIVACKENQEFASEDEEYVRVCGLKLQEVATLEATMRNMLSGRTSVSEEEYKNYYNLILSVFR